MRQEPVFETLYVPLPPDLWAQAAYLTMRPGVVREQASAMLVRVAHVVGELANDAGYDAPEFEDLPAEQQARVVELVRTVLTRFAAPNGR